MAEEEKDQENVWERIKQNFKTLDDLENDFGEWFKFEIIDNQGVK